MSINSYDKVENPEAHLAWQCVERTGVNIFLTGKAGTGKTTFLRRLREASPKRMIVVAPTGVAAINAGGVTIHSFFQLPFSPFIPGAQLEQQRISAEKLNIIRTLDLLVIDEISMVRADLLDCIDQVLRRYRDRNLPFGGIQLLMIGDLQQLAPVVRDSEANMLRQYYDSMFFYGSRALQQSDYVTVELQRVYRQSDRIFIGMLNKIRDNVADTSVLEQLNSRYIADFNPSDSEGYIRLTTHNHIANKVNDAKLSALPAATANYDCVIKGTFPESAYPAEKTLVLKVGAQVMFLKNDPSPQKRYFNGKIGHVVSLTHETVKVKCSADEDDIEVAFAEWSNSKYVLDRSTNEIHEEVEGSFSQIPLRLAWAITIHKSQGLTFDKAIIDAESSFAHGQVYVALSRCRSIEGLVLSSRLQPQSVISDANVVGFMNKMRQAAVDDNKLSQLETQYYIQQVRSLFNFMPLNGCLQRILRFFEENCYKLYPKSIEVLKEQIGVFSLSIFGVAEKFIAQSGIKSATEQDLSKDEVFTLRVKNGAQYFNNKLADVLSPVVEAVSVDLDNKELKRQHRDLLKAFDSELNIKSLVMEDVSKNGFEVTSYLKIRANAMLANESVKPAVSKVKAKLKAPIDVVNADLFETLRQWRNETATKLGVAAYAVLQQKALMAVANYLPDTYEKLLSMPALGAATADKYGKEIISIVANYISENKIDTSHINMPVNETNDEKIPKIDTYSESFQLFNKYGSIEAVVKDRGLTTSTILRHLSRYVLNGELPLEKLIDLDKQKDIELDFKLHPDDTTSERKNRLGEKISYEDLRLMAEVLKKV